ncbi:MAG: sulfotransferase family 2 domain-containing protein [Xenococcaceae cyanobacterium MO_188.B29]|nr:sulfotransferase family 2 domain-containing protein [Xenococcaceae cyanobacterium MO_188.B29]
MNSIKSLQPKPSVIFLHIPKTAGTTLNQILLRQYKSENIFQINGDRVFSSIEEFKHLTEENRKKIRLLNGHMYFGLHEFLPQPSTYITLLRNPIKRVISHYYYVLREPNHYLHKRVKNANMSLHDYVSSDISKELINGQTRLIAGLDGQDIDNEQKSLQALTKAKQNLTDNFSVVGLTEKFDETLIVLQKMFDWKNIFYVKNNINTKKNVYANIPKNTISIIKDRNSIDIELYQYAEEILTQKVNLISTNFERDLDNFKLLNNVYGKINNTTNKLKEKIRV